VKSATRGDPDIPSLRDLCREDPRGPDRRTESVVDPTDAAPDGCMSRPKVHFPAISASVSVAGPVPLDLLFHTPREPRVSGLLRKALAAFASLVFATVGLALVAAPAHATPNPTAELKAYAVCDPSKQEWVVTWKLTNKDGTKSATLSNLTPSQATAISNIDNGAVIGANGTLTGVQRFPGSVTSATLKVDLTWAYDPTITKTVEGPWGNYGLSCSSSTPCVNIGAGTFKHTFTAANLSPTTSARIWRSGQQPFKPLCAAQTLSLVSYFALSASFALPQYVFDYQTEDFTPTTYELNFQVAMPPCFTQSDFVTGEKIDPLTDSSGLYGNRKIGSGAAPGNMSSGPQAWFNGKGTAGGICSHPAATVTPKCDGSGIVQLSNGLAPGFANVTFTWKLAGVSDPSYTQSVAPSTSHSFTVIHSQFPVEVTGSNGFTTTLNWSWPPTDCEQPTLVVGPDCTNLILKVTNPNSKTVNVTAAYNGDSQTKPVSQGNTTIFTFPAGTGTATITIDGAPYWTSLTASFADSDTCHLADTGISATGLTVVGASLAAAGALLIYLVAHTLGRRRRAA
jgi:hypothetical protein